MFEVEFFLNGDFRKIECSDKLEVVKTIKEYGFASMFGVSYKGVDLHIGSFLLMFDDYICLK